MKLVTIERAKGSGVVNVKLEHAMNAVETSTNIKKGSL